MNPNPKQKRRAGELLSSQKATLALMALVVIAILTYDWLTR